MKLEGSTARWPYRIGAGLLAVPLWLMVCGYVLGGAMRGNVLLVLFFILPSAVALTLVSATGKAPAWFLKKFSGD